MTPAEKYAVDIAWGLRWNMENRHLYVHGKWAVIELNFVRIVRGKPRDEKISLGVVPKEDADQFISELTAALHDPNYQGKSLHAPNISDLKFSFFVAHIGWRVGDNIVSDFDIEQRHGQTDLAKTLKQLKSL